MKAFASKERTDHDSCTVLHFILLQREAEKNCKERAKNVGGQRKSDA